MKFISLGLQCYTPIGIDTAKLRNYSYPFDWFHCPSKTTYEILFILINDGINKAIEYMTTGYTYYNYINLEGYISTTNVTKCQMNKETGLGVVHHIINDDFKDKLKRRFERFLTDILSLDNILFIYTDGLSFQLNYYLDYIEYGVDATFYLLKIYDLIYPLNKNIQMLYFCWHERKLENNIIKYIPFEYKNTTKELSSIVCDYLITQYK